MSLVVQPTSPFRSFDLQLEDSTRWSRLLPLMRPSAKIFELANGHNVVVDMNLMTSQNVLVIVIGTLGNISSKILSESHVALFTAERVGQEAASTQELVKLLQRKGFQMSNGIVVVRSSSKAATLAASERVVEVSVKEDLKLDHVLSLLSSAKNETKSSFEKTKAMLESFVQSSTVTNSIFDEQKAGNGPVVLHDVDIADFRSAKSAIDRDLSKILSSQLLVDSVYSVHYSDMNGLSRLENNILAHEISCYLERRNFPSFISQSTILSKDSHARGWAISISTIPAEFLAAQTTPSNKLEQTAATKTTSKLRKGSPKIQVTDDQVRKIITAGCESVIKDEPTITEYDTIVGDGDCGYTLRDGAKQVMSFIATADLSTLASTLGDLVDDLEVNMGGTSGALYCIFLSSLAQNLWDAPTFPIALKASLDHLLKYTRARLGDRTCLDCLIPFVETLKESGESKKALLEAEKGVERTKKLEARLGRSSYLDEAATRGVPDPGAYGLYKLLQGMVDAQ